MKADPRRLARRQLLRGSLAGASLLLGGAGEDFILPALDEDPSIIVAGPVDSHIAAWARLMLPALRASLGNAGLHLRCIGGRDGVTAANQFQARATPDGSQALLFAGSLALPWMAGDCRAQFEPSRLLPLVSLSGPGLVMLRGGLSADRRSPVRLACGHGPDPAQTALMAFDLLGIPAEIVPHAQDRVAAVARGDVDVVFLTGERVAEQAMALRGAGLRIAFTTSGHSSAFDDAPFDDAPNFLELLPPAQVAEDPRVAAWRAMAEAGGLELVLALPRFSAAASVANWRTAIRAVLAGGALPARVARSRLTLLTDPGALSALRSIGADPDAQLALRRWMATRMNWQPA